MGEMLLERVREIRRQLTDELGIVIPKIRIIDNAILEPSEYCIKIHIMQH